MPTAPRFIRSLGPNKWAVIIDTHTAPTAEQRELAREDGYDGYDYPPVGQRAPGQPVAILRSTGVVTEIYILADRVRLLATCADTILGTAKRLAEGEFDNDFRFEYLLNPEPSCNADLYFITQYATPSQQRVDSWTTEDPGNVIATARECQEYTLEERWAMDAEAGR